MAKLTFFGNGTPFERLSILVVTTGEFTSKLKDSMLLENKNSYDGRLQINFCESVEYILTSSYQNLTADFIAVVLDLRNSDCIDIVEDSIRSVDSLYLCGRFCLVNGTNNLRPSEIGIPPDAVVQLSQKYSVNLINGDVLIPQNCMSLAKRIMILATSAAGYKTGIPLVLDIPCYP